MADEGKPKNTHVLHVVFENGISVPDAWCQQDGVEYLSEANPDYLVLHKADGSRARYTRNKIIFYKVAPWKDLPESVKAQIEKAKAAPSPIDRVM